MEKYITSSELTKDDLITARKNLGMTQKAFAEMIGTSVKSVERWESGNVKIPGQTAFIVQLLFANPDYAEKISVPEKKLPLRIWYLYYNMPCTLIEADERERIVRIKNYTNRIFYRAFGKNTEPTYEDFEEFLESRCFPRERDKQKIMLNALDLPFYSPLAIIEKTGGRMAEDNFRLIIEK